MRANLSFLMDRAPSDLSDDVGSAEAFIDRALDARGSREAG
jgi:hypothetical protein